MTQASKIVTKERKIIIPCILYSIVHNCLTQHFLDKTSLDFEGTEVIKD